MIKVGAFIYKRDDMASLDLNNEGLRALLKPLRDQAMKYIEEGAIDMALETVESMDKIMKVLYELEVPNDTDAI